MLSVLPRWDVGLDAALLQMVAEWLRSERTLKVTPFEAPCRAGCPQQIQH